MELETMVGYCFPLDIFTNVNAVLSDIFVLSPL